MTELALTSPTELALVQGDLSKLSESERAGYYQQVCQSVGLNPLTKPFQYIVLNKKLTLYATKDAAAQIRKLHGISFTNIQRDVDAELGIVTYTVTGRDGKGREDTEIGAVSLWATKWDDRLRKTVVTDQLMRGEELCNAYMKALTKAKRRLSLSLGGLGWLDETELETIPSATPFTAELEPHPQLPAANEQSDEEKYGDRLTVALDVTKDFGPNDLENTSNTQLERVGYGPQEGRKLLIELFPGKTSRKQLTEAEMRIFISELMNLPSRILETANG